MNNILSSDQKEKPFENDFENLDLGEKSDLPNNAEKKITSKEMLITGELGHQALIWYENYVVAGKNELAFNEQKNNFNWELGNGEKVNIEQIDNYIASLIEIKSLIEINTAIQPEDRKSQKETIEVQILDTITERFLAELAFMTVQKNKMLKKVENSLMLAFESKDQKELKNAQKNLEEISNIFNIFVLMGENDFKFDQYRFFQRYKELKENLKVKNISGNYISDLTTWNERFNRTIKGNNHENLEQVQTLESSLIGAFKEIKFMIQGNGYGNGGIAEALAQIETELLQNTNLRVVNEKEKNEQEVQKIIKVMILPENLKIESKAKVETNESQTHYSRDTNKSEQSNSEGISDTPLSETSSGSKKDGIKVNGTPLEEYKKTESST